MGAGRGQVRRAQTRDIGLDKTPGGFHINGKISESSEGEVLFYPKDADIALSGDKPIKLGRMFDVRQLMGEEVEMRIFTGDPQSLRKIARGVVGISNVGTTLSAISIGSRLASGYFDDLKIWGEVAHLEVELATYQTTVPDLENLEPLSF